MSEQISRFHLNTKQLFLTYPQCPETKDELLFFFQQLFSANLDKYIIAHEHHANGDHHLHAYVKLRNAYQTRSPNCLDFYPRPPATTFYHGNYQGCRSTKRVMDYCTKEEDYIANFDVGAIATKSNRAEIAKKLVGEKRPLHSLLEEYPQLIFGYKNLKMDLTIYQEDIAPEKDNLPIYLPNPWGRVLHSAKNSKRRHYWIFSRRPNFGKTYHFAIPLTKEFRAIIATGDLHYWNVNKHTQCVILDDYNTAKLKWDSLNQLADGTYQFRVAYRGVVVLARYLVVILSNQSIRDLYPNMNEFIYERFQEIELV